MNKIKEASNDGERSPFTRNSSEHSNSTTASYKSLPQSIDFGLERKHGSIDNMRPQLIPDQSERTLPSVLTSQQSRNIDSLQWLQNHCSWENESVRGMSGDGETALHLACGSEKPAPVMVVRNLLTELDKHVINSKNKNFGNTALHAACYSLAPVETVNMLLRETDDVTLLACNNYGQTALHLACMRGGNGELLYSLVSHEYGKSLSLVRNAAGKIPFDLFPLGDAERAQYMKSMLHLLTLLHKDDPTGKSFPTGLLTSIASFSYDDRNRFVNHPYLRTALNTEIVKTSSLFILFLDVAVQLLVMIIFSYFVPDGKIKKRATGILIFTLVMMLCREGVQLCAYQVTSYLDDASNFIDLAQIAMIISVLHSAVQRGEIEEIHLVFCIAVSWARLLFVTANLNPNVAVFVDAFKAVSQKMIPFMYVVSLICLAFAHMYEVFGPPPDVECDDEEKGGWTCKISESYFHAFAMTLSGEWFFLDSISGPLSAISIAFALLVGLVLMNMLIALISNKYTDVEAMSENAFWAHRLMYIDELNRMFIFLKRLSPFPLNTFKKFENKTNHLPERMNMTIFHLEKINEWARIQKYEDVMKWFWGLDSKASVPSFSERMNTFLLCANWAEILKVSMGFKKFFLGFKHGDNKPIPISKNVFAWVGCSMISGLVYLKAIIMGPLGLVTGGYFWARELKEYIFFGETRDAKADPENSIETRVRGIMQELFETQTAIEMQNNNLKDKVQELSEQNQELKSQVSKILEILLENKK